MVFFPKEIMTIIYQFDKTYRDKYNDVMGELKRLYVKYNLYIHNYMFHNDLFMNNGLEYRSICYFAKRL